MLDESYRLLSALQHDQSLSNARMGELQDYAINTKESKSEVERALTAVTLERDHLAKENMNLSELYKIASDSLREGNTGKKKEKGWICEISPLRPAGGADTSFSLLEFISCCITLKELLRVHKI